MGLTVCSLIDLKSVFGMNVDVLSPDTNGTLAHYFEVAIREQSNLHPYTIY